MYLNKLDEEANYFTVKEEEEEDICTCSTCIVSSLIVRYLYMIHFHFNNLNDIYT